MAKNVKTPVDTTEWVEEVTGLPPYWKPVEEGDSVTGVLIARDDQDPDHVRYRLRAVGPLTCYSGPTDSAEEVRVEEGGYFSVSEYHAITNVFSRYLKAGISPKVKITFESKDKCRGGKNTVWNISCLVEKSARMALVAAERQLPLQLTMKNNGSAEEIPF